MNITQRALSLYNLRQHKWNDMNCREQSDFLVSLRDLQLEIDPANAEHATAQAYLNSVAASIGVWIGPGGEIERRGM